MSNIEKQSCEGVLTDFECEHALKEMQNQKSPGSDGFSAEFYKHFWPVLKEHYVKSINFSFGKGSLTDLQRQGIISLIPKQGKDIDSLAYWRPVSLLNVDYKIATKAIAKKYSLILFPLINQVF